MANRRLIRHFHPIQSVHPQTFPHHRGIASDLVSGQVYFTEEHEEFLTDERLPELTLIQYKNPKGKIIVRKKIDYTHHPGPDQD